VRFAGREVFPLRFIQRHYPVRGQAHGERKVFRERQGRFREAERARGWHVQYDGFAPGASFIRDPETMTLYDPDAVRAEIALHHRGAEMLERERDVLLAERDRLQTALETLQQTFDAQRASLEAAIHDRDGTRLALDAARTATDTAAAEAERLRHELAWTALQLSETSRDRDNYRAGHARLSGEVATLHRSKSWRWMAPARALFRLLTGRES
jgi:hypothetical protein